MTDATNKDGKAAASQAERRIIFADRDDAPEAFADSIQTVFFDGQTLRIDFCTTRPVEAGQDKGITLRRTPSCRMVLTASAASDLINNLQRVAAALAEAAKQRQAAQFAAEKKS